MKKIASILILVFALTVTTQAQHRDHKVKKHKREKLTVDQRATLGAKRLALALDLDDSQIRRVTNLFKKKGEAMTVRVKKMKTERANKKKRMNKSSFERMNKSLDAKIGFQKKMKQILNKEQYAKFLKLKKHGKKKMRTKVAKRKKVMKREKMHKNEHR
jgi:hypothetical protein